MSPQFLEKHLLVKIWIAGAGKPVASKVNLFLSSFNRESDSMALQNFLYLESNSSEIKILSRYKDLKHSMLCEVQNKDRTEIYSSFIPDSISRPGI